MNNFGSKFSRDWKDTFIGLGAGTAFLLFFWAIGQEVIGALLFPAVAIGVAVLSGESSHRKEIKGIQAAEDADYQAAKKFLDERDKRAKAAAKEAYDSYANTQERERLRHLEQRRIRAEQQRIDLGYEPQLGTEVAPEAYAEDWKKFNKKLAEVVHTLTPFKPGSTPRSAVLSELDQVSKKLELGNKFMFDLTEGEGQGSVPQNQISRLKEVMSRLEGHKQTLEVRSVICRFKEWDSQLNHAISNNTPWLELDQMTQVAAWLSSRIRPEAQPFGVSHEGAEHLVAGWLNYLGQAEVQVTQFVGDGGVDVETEDLVVQVKNYGEGGVSSPELRDLLGTATAAAKGAALFTSSRLTKDARTFAEENEIACIAYDAKLATLSALTPAGKRLLEQGHYAES